MTGRGRTAPTVRARRPAAPRVLATGGKAVLVISVVVAGLWTATHGIAGVSWREVLSVLRDVRPRELALLALIWMGGLGIYARVLAAAMPGLGVRRSLVLNLGGSAVSNVLPLGGAVATALNWRMARTWGHSTPAFAAYCALTNALDVLTKLALPVVAVGTFAMLSLHVPAVLWTVAGGCALAAVLILAVPVWVLRRDPRHTSGEAGWRSRMRSSVRDSADRVRELLARGWATMVPASVGYVVTQVLLLVVCLRVVGLEPAFTVVLMAAAIERLGTLVPLTPGGTGVAEIGTIA
ncbi:MAG TPA: lysylphosphatidylglycerol synthase transmembrane domain-containing protein, partial [Nocardioidaceae bacterium]|nr:lysylphosphatidylglycerol synthase transmembrane domain-containing protein [Nocardioidaceae bacterium]